MSRALQFLVCLALAGLIAGAAARTPLRAASAGGFLAQAAMADVAVIGVRPHPVGSAELARVRDYLVGRLRGMGLRTQVWRGEGVQRNALPNRVLVEGGEVQDIVAVLPGRSPGAPALLMMAHYDTVPSSPGAADDSVGVAAVLQIASLLKAGPQPARDVVILLTDGEEAGLLGARAFFGGHPLAPRVGAVINFEAEGGGGPAYMFETGPANGGMIGLFARTARRPNANSLSGFVYSLLPNDTDFSVSRRRGVGGLNFALIGRQFDYHAASAVPASVDPASVQQLGDMAAPAALALARARALPAPSSDAVYGDLLGWRILAYPAWAGWIVLILAAGVGALAFAPPLQCEGVRPASLLLGAAAPLLAAGLFALLATAARAGTGSPHGFVDGRALLARFGLYEAALAACAAAGLIFAVRLLTLRRTSAWNALAGGYALILLLAVAVQLAAPPTAQILAWPLAAAGVVGAVLPRRLDGPAGWTRAVATALPLAQVLHIGHGMALTIGADLPQAPALAVLAGAPLLLPMLWPGDEPVPLGRLGVAALAMAAGLTAFLRSTDPFGPRHPQPTDIRYVADLSSDRFWRTSGVGADAPWTRAALEADGGEPRRIDISPFLGPVAAAAARPIALSRPLVVASRLPDGSLSLAIRPSAPGAQTRLEIDAPGLQVLQLDGRTVPLGPATRRLDVIWDSPAGVALTVRTTGPAKVSYADIRLSWPADARPLPPRPPGLMPWGRSDSTIVLGSLTVP
jgi:hypothetical protein